MADSSDPKVTDIVSRIYQFADKFQSIKFIQLPTFKDKPKNRFLKSLKSSFWSLWMHQSALFEMRRFLSLFLASQTHPSNHVVEPEEFYLKPGFGHATTMFFVFLQSRFATYTVYFFLSFCWSFIIFFLSHKKGLLRHRDRRRTGWRHWNRLVRRNRAKNCKKLQRARWEQNCRQWIQRIEISPCH